MKFLPALFFAAIVLVSVSCRQDPVSKKSVDLERPAYSQSFKSNVALLVLEWNGQPRILASGFVIEKQKGIFMTARHFTDAVRNQGTDRCKLFTNGLMYDVYIIKVPSLRDAALVRIEGVFDPNHLSDPDVIAKTLVQKDDQVFFRGLHAHPWQIRKSNADEGVEDIVVPVFREHYGIEMRDPALESEIVFDSLEATVLELDARIRIGSEEKDEGLDGVRYDTNRYYHLKTKRNHKFSFGGLSGGPALNASGELIGLNTAEESQRFEVVPETPRKEPKKLKLQITVEVRAISDTLYVTPIQAVLDLYEYAESVD